MLLLYKLSLPIDKNALIDKLTFFVSVFDHRGWVYGVISWHHFWPGNIPVGNVIDEIKNDISATDIISSDDMEEVKDELPLLELFSHNFKKVK